MKNNAQFLSVIDQQWLPFNVKGTSDIAILKKDYSKCLGQEANGARLLFELKKVGNINARERYQAQLQLVLANYWSRFHVLVVLTDLNNHWEIMWEYDREIMTCFPSRDVAINIIQAYINKESSNESEESEDVQPYSSHRNELGPLAKRKKLDIINTVTNDIADFTDFADKIPITEMKQKLMERFLRETFNPSSTYGQLVANMNEDTMLTIPYIG